MDALLRRRMMRLAGGSPGPTPPTPPTPTPTPVLPEGYTQLQYILNTNINGYINTGYYPNNNTRVVIEFNNIGYTRQNWEFLYGARNSSYCKADYSFNVFTDSTKARETFGNVGAETEADLLSQKHVIIDKNKNVTTIKDLSSGTIIYTKTFADNTFSTPSAFLLYNQNRATTPTGTTIANSQSAIGKVYSLMIYDEGILVRNYVPCKNPQNVVGLYDLVNKTFVRGSQSLSPGPEVVPTPIPTHYFMGRNLAIIGDSISTYDASGYKYDSYSMYYPYGEVNSVDYTYWKKLMNDEAATLEVNLSYSGSCACSRSGYVSLNDRIGLVGNADTVIIALGTNDSAQSKPLGGYLYDTPYSELGETNFREAYIKGIKGLLAANPNIDIVCAIFSMGADYRNSIKAIAAHYNLKCIDCGNDYSKVQGVHPNVAGMIEIETHFLYD